MNSIDILEEKEKIKDKLFPITHINGYINLYEQKEARIYTSELSRWQSATKDSLNLIKTLIAENKELKERNKRQQENLKITNKKIAAQRGQLMMLNKAYIPKSKVEEKIEQLDYNDIGNFERRCKREVLQSLLEKE